MSIHSREDTGARVGQVFCTEWYLGGFKWWRMLPPKCLCKEGQHCPAEGEYTKNFWPHLDSEKM